MIFMIQNLQEYYFSIMTREVKLWIEWFVKVMILKLQRTIKPIYQQFNAHMIIHMVIINQKILHLISISNIVLLTNIITINNKLMMNMRNC